jgi:glycerophosphoryl diester phosphodiesterase
MDYFQDLASHPDVLEAIRRESDRNLAHAKAAHDLLLSEFLREEHPTVWTVEIVRAFYRTPKFAARVWVNLRYCEQFRQRLSLHKLRAESRRSSSTDDGDPDIRDAVKKFGRHPREAVQQCSAAISKDEVIEDLMKKSGLLPDPPTFLRTLMEAVDTPKGGYDEMTQRLLANPEAVRRLARKTGVAVPFSMVLHDELEQIEATRGNVHRVQRPGHADPSVAESVGSSGEDAPIRRALDMDLLGLAFSGGGIRSATFNLGILQALSKIGLLRQCDYLSTVSGGGYIGSWLSAWIRREANATGDSSTTMADIQRRLSPLRSPNPMDERVRPIRFLREYSNYLTPRTGFFSADTWTMIGIYTRNALLNQVIIVTLFGAALIVPRLTFALTQRGRIEIWLPWLLWAFGAGVLIVNLIRLRPPQQTSTAAGHKRAPKLDDPVDRVLSWFARPLVIQVGVVLPWVLAAAMAATYFSYRQTSPTHGFAASETYLSVAGGVVVGASLLFVLVFGRIDRCWVRTTAVPRGVWSPLRRRVDKRVRQAARRLDPIYDGVRARVDEETRGLLAEMGADLAQAWHAAWVILLAAIVSGIVASGLTWVVVRALLMLSAGTDARQWHTIGLGTAGLLSVLSLSIVVMLGMLGEKFPDEHREWWSKFRTFIHVWAIAWAAAFLVAVYVPWGFHWLWNKTYSTELSLTAVIGWALSTLFGVHKGRTAEDDKKEAHESGEEGVPMSAGLVRLAAQVAPYVFIVGLVFGISIAIDRVFMANHSPLKSLGEYWEFATWTSTGASWTLSLPRLGVSAINMPWTLTATLGLLAVGLLFSWRVDVNEFSLHHFYKNRLVRCYLGASHTAERQADWFTGFDPHDDVRLKDFDHDAFGGPKYPGPYPILNCALNLVGGEDLAWQERKSTSFVFTPKFCGYDVDRAVITSRRNGLREDAYVPTRNYYHAGEGPRLGMAMAISGAAANPNMGRASSPAMAFLMTVFNVRLGWWVGNPRKRDGVAKPSPRIGLPYTALELFGGTDDHKKYVNLSDGGHFENLGVYELIRRGCRYIILCDAGQDDKFLGEDLATLVRQCRTDFGVEIDIDIHRICERKDERISQTHCVVGRIHYHHIPRRTRFGRLMNEDEGPLLRGSRPAHEKGYLIYLKPSLTGDEAQDLVEYSKRIPEFPHQTTADQWFDESQFESYRKLGMHIGEEAFTRYQDEDTKPLADLGQLFRRLRGYWYPPSQAINANSTNHVNEYTRIMELIRTQTSLRTLDHTMFDKLPEIGDIDPREEFYVCNALIQLIENVYADLELELLWRHPHVQGWMTVFRRWAQQPAFRRTWRISEWTYAERFRNFYNDRLRGRPLALPRSFVASHRGLGNGVKENTVDAFTRAIGQGASVVELDVRRLKDGELVLWHDPTVGGQAVETLTLPQLRTCMPHVETLRHCATQLHGLVQLDVELKTPDIERQVIDVLRDDAAPWRRRDFVLTSFDQSMIRKVRVRDPYVRTGVLLDEREAYDRAVECFIHLRADFLAPEESLLRKNDLDSAAEQRVPLVPWSVNDESRLAFLLKHDIVAGVITDEVARAVDVKRRI